jgi:hypothetical protein
LGKVTTRRTRRYAAALKPHYTLIHDELLGDLTRRELIEALDNLRFKKRPTTNNTHRPMCTVELDIDVRDTLVLALRAR